MKTTLFMVMSVNGFIADKNGSEDFLSQDNWVEFVRLTKLYGGFVWGRKTYESVKTWSSQYLEDLKGVKKFIMTNKLDYKGDENLIYGNSPQDILKKAEGMGIDNLIITGGPNTNSEFAKLNLIDDVILNLEPTLIASGKNLFKDDDFQLKMELISQKVVAGKILQLHYKVIKKA